MLFHLHSYSVLTLVYSSCSVPYDCVDRVIWTATFDVLSTSIWIGTIDGRDDCEHEAALSWNETFDLLVFEHQQI